MLSFVPTKTNGTIPWKRNWKSKPKELVKINLKKKKDKNTQNIHILTIKD